MDQPQGEPPGFAESPLDNQPNTPSAGPADTSNRADEKSHGKNEEHLLLEWTAPSRPYKKRDREYYTTVGIIVVLVSLILLFAGQFLFMGVVIALAFVAYALAAVPPENVHNAITTFGVRTGAGADQVFYWEELGRFWFSNRYKSELLHIETSRAFPGQLILLLDGVNKEELKKILLQYTIFEKPRPTWLDKAAKWLQEKFPLDKDEPQT